MTTTRSVRDEVKNVLDYLLDAELAHYVNDVAMAGATVTWHALDKSAPFNVSHHGDPSVDQYIAWASAGAYSALLFDGSLLQISFSVDGGEIAGHRLAYVPCPYDIDRELLDLGMPIVDVVDGYRSSDPILRSPLRFDFDPRAAGPRHPASHLTINGSDCRIACAAPLHTLRFVDFVFRQFYPALWLAHEPFFRPAAWLHAGPGTLSTDDQRGLHLSWDHRATAEGDTAGTRPRARRPAGTRPYTTTPGRHGARA